MGNRRNLWSRISHPLLAVLSFIVVGIALAAPSDAQVADGKVHLTADGLQAASQAPVRMIVVLAQPAVAQPAVAQQAVTGSPESRLASMRAGAVTAASDFLTRASNRGIVSRIEERINRRYDYFPYIAMNLSLSEANALASDPGVTAIVEDTQSQLDLNVSIPLVKADQVWAKGPEGAGQTIAILDTGVDFDQIMLAGKIVASACFSSNSTATRTMCPDGTTQQLGGRAGDDCMAFGTTGCDHGTHVAGIAAGRATVVNRTTNGVTSAVTLRGVAPSADIVAVQVFSQKLSDNSATSFSSDQIAAFNWLLPQVSALHLASINMSLGSASVSGACDNNVLKSSIDAMRAVGVLTAIAAGNDGSANGAGPPGCITTAMTVGATDNNDALASFTNSGVQVDLWAPGVGIESSVPSPSASAGTCCFFAAFSGTSMSTPHVAGAIALLKSAKPTATADEIENVLKTTGPLITDTRNSITRPRLDLLAAFNAMNAATVPRLTVTPDGFTTFSVSFGGAASPSSRVFTVTNPSGAPATNVHVASSDASVTVSIGGVPTSSVDFPLAADGSQAVTVLPNGPFNLDVGSTEITFTATGAAPLTRGIRIDSTPMTVTPGGLVTLVGPVGGPFTVGGGATASATYTATNGGAGAISAGAAVNQPWLTLSAGAATSTGSIAFSAAPGPTTLTATATGNASANAQALGVYHAIMTVAAGATTFASRQVDLRVTVANDLFANAATLQVKSGQPDPTVLQGTGNNTNSYFEPSEPGQGTNVALRSLWWKFTPTISGVMQADTTGSNFDTVLGVFKATNPASPSVSTLSAIVANDDAAPGVLTSKTTFPVTAGTTYYVVVDGFTGGTGNITLNVAPAVPNNDLVANAILLPGSSGIFAGITNAGATRSAGEPNHFGAATGHSIWYRWIASSSGQLQVDTQNNNFNTILAVYQPTSAGGLVETESDSGSGAGSGASRTFVNVTANHIYYIAVDGTADATGSTDLKWDFQSLFSSIVSSTLPSSRRTVVNRPVTIFANMINGGTTTLTSCSISAAKSFPGTFSYQTADAANQLTGTANTPVSIPPNAVQNFVLTASSAVAVSSGELGLVYSCVGSRHASLLSNLNTWLLRVDPGASTPDVIAIGATSGTPGVVTVPLGGAAAFSVASVNIGATSAAAGTTVIQLQTTQPNGNMTLSVCETNPATGACLAAPTTSVSVPSYATNAVHTFSVFVQSNGVAVPFDPASNRIAAVFKDADGNIYGATSVAVRTP